jgi:hypothetical protein
MLQGTSFPLGSPLPPSNLGLLTQSVSGGSHGFCASTLHNPSVVAISLALTPMPPAVPGSPRGLEDSGWWAVGTANLL